MLFDWIYIEQTGGKVVFILTTLLVLIMAVVVIVLFVVFSRRKNKLLIEKAEAKKRYEREIAETQIEIREETLRNISWELHDNIGQLLTLAKIQLQHASIESMDEISQTITKSLEEIRSLSKLINPEFINNVKLKEALRLEIERFNRLKYIDAEFIVKGEERELREKHSIILFRILQEFFSNTVKHSRASELKVILNFKPKELEIIAEDNGVGFEPKKIRVKGIGLQNIKTRAKLIHANVEVESKPNKGTSLKINYYF